MITFLVMATAISLSGVLAPGPMTAATLAAGTRSRHAGALIALGHAAIEFPLMVVIVTGAGRLFQLPDVDQPENTAAEHTVLEAIRIGIGLAGGVVLLLMGLQLLMTVRKPMVATEISNQRHPFWTGVVLSAANPYFLIWWMTVGLALATEAVELGIMAFVLFAVIHWLCDLVWLETLSFASHKGTEIFGDRIQQIVLVVCGTLLVFFGGKFLYDAGIALFG